jgi:anti-sigma factor RsiW
MSELKNILNSGEGKQPSEEKLLAYLEGRLSPEEQHEVELYLAEEGMESDAMEGLKQLPSEDTKATVSKLNWQLRQQLQKKAHRRRQPIRENKLAWAAVAFILLLCVLAYVVLHLSLKK